MPVDEPNTIDIVAQAANGDVSLVVSDHLDWGDSLEHQRILQAKLNAYLRFVESGEVFDKFPNARDKPISIEIVFFEKPDRDGRIFLTLWEQTFREAGLPLTHRFFAESYNN